MKTLIIQTAFIGDVILATPVIEALCNNFPNVQTDFLLRKGNEGLLANHPKLRKVWVWNKKEGKYKTLLRLVKQIRKEKYDCVINIQRFATSGIITAFSGGKVKIGFKKNPLSFTYHYKMEHTIACGMHEIDRNLSLLEALNKSPFLGKKADIEAEPAIDISSNVRQPKLYPSKSDFEKVGIYKQTPYVCMAPASVWFTKQLPKEKWIELVNALPKKYTIYFLGAPSDTPLVEKIIKCGKHSRLVNLCGKNNLLQSAALMQHAQMNYVNDSAPMHLASAVDAPVTIFFCSTIPGFGFGPLSTNSQIAEFKEKLDCRPCGLHGKKACPKGHFKCAYGIKVENYACT